MPSDRISAQSGQLICLPGYQFFTDFNCQVKVEGIIKERRKRFAARFKTGRQGQQPKGLARKPKFITKFQQAIFCTGTTDAEKYASTSLGPIVFFKGNLEKSGMFRKEFQVPLTGGTLIIVTLEDFQNSSKVSSSLSPRISSIACSKTRPARSRLFFFDIDFIGWVNLEARFPKIQSHGGRGFNRSKIMPSHQKAWLPVNRPFSSPLGGS